MAAQIKRMFIFHISGQTDDDIKPEGGALGWTSLFVKRLSSKCLSDAIARNEELFEWFGVRLSGILAVDRDILKKMHAMQGMFSSPKQNQKMFID